MTLRDVDDLDESQRRLYEDLQDAGAPDAMLECVRLGVYHDYKSDLPMPKYRLVADCKTAGLDDIARRAMHEGRYDDPAPDGTTEDIFSELFAEVEDSA